MNKFLLSLFIVLFTFYFAQSEEKSLVHRQEAIKKMFMKVEDKLLRIAEKLKEEEPENAKLMINAFKKANESLVELQMKTAMESLDKNEFEASIIEQEKVIEKLMAILSTLMDEDLSVKQEIEKLEKLKAEVEKMIKKQDQLTRESEKTNDKEATSKEIKKAIERLEIAKKRAEKNLGVSKESRMKGMNTQSQIARELDSVKNEIRAVFKQLNKKDLEVNDSNKIELNDPKNGEKNDLEDGEPGSNQLKDAVKNLKNAEDKIVEGNYSKSEDSQSDAIDNITKAIKELSKEMNRIEELPEENNLKISEEQKELRDRLSKVQSELQPGRPQEKVEETKNTDGQEGETPNGEEKENSSKENGGSPQESKGDSKSQPSGGEEGQPQDSDGSKGNSDESDQKPKNAFDKGRKYMYEAEKNLKEAKLKKAMEDQKKSSQELKKIRDDINKTLDQLRDEEKEEKLAGLESRFREMLQSQNRIKLDIKDIHNKKLNEKFTRMEQAQLNQITIDETELKEKCNKAYDILFEDATSIVFPEIVKQLVEDFDEISIMFGKGEVGELPQLLVNETIISLEELIESLVKAQEDLKKEKEAGKPSDKKGNNGNGQSIVSKSNELKLLRRIQQRVNKVSEIYSNQNASELSKDAFDVYKAQLKRIYEKQKDVYSLTKKMNERN